MSCECLAAWVDSEPCICNEPIGAPMEVSAAKVSKADRLVRHVRSIDRYLSALKADRSYEVRLSRPTEGEYGLEIHVPADILAGLVRTMRFHALVELSETGVVSLSGGHRPMVTA